MKIPFTLLPPPHSKGGGRKKEDKKRRGKRYCFCYLTMRLKATPSKMWGCVVFNQDVSARRTGDSQWNDGTTVRLNARLNLLPLKGAIIRVSTNPEHM